MDDAIAVALANLLVPILIALLTPVVLWFVSLLPGPARAYLQSATHQRDIELLVGAMTRRALAQVTGVKTATATQDLVAYARAHLPDTVAKLKPTDEALTTIAMAALQRAKAELGSPSP